jgi:hypothetical protein
MLRLFFLYTGMKSPEQQAGNIDDAYIESGMDDPSNQQPV